LRLRTLTAATDSQEPRSLGGNELVRITVQSY